ncbi:hypothetical protein SD939_10415 [Lactobacillus crispatus]|uniref:hypothetical protein n=1 Tax=Lactobacillus crispatus TaxID=47770 RepID=UPI0029C23C3F|nr:hypothetical protein [Lactobacillus crispatus]MDX5091619.1 hypothetical protein [Lactobacillus crispatus]
MVIDQWREILREYVVYGILFKAIAKDADTLNQIELKMSYRPMMDVVSVWAERKHHEYRREFSRLGGKIHLQEKQDRNIYFVLVTVRGMQHENVYSIEMLKAECQARLIDFFRNVRA